MKIAIATINEPSLKAAQKLAKLLDNHECHIFNKQIEDGKRLHKFTKVDEILPTAWSEFDALIFIMATGAVVRKVAPFLKDKATDPAVVIVTLDLKKVIPLLSGHLGGANELAEEICAKVDGCVNFVTTASDQTDRFAFDLFAKAYNFAISNLKSLAEVSNAIINRKKVQVVSFPSIFELIKRFKGYKEENFVFCSIDNLLEFDANLPSVYITPQHLANSALQLHPQEIVLGLGMNRGTPKEEIQNAVLQFCLEHQLKLTQVTKLASFSKKADEDGLLAFAKEQNLPLEFFNEAAINELERDFSPSQATKFFGIKGVAEPAALLASRYKTLFLNKRIYGGVTVAASF